MADRKVVLTMRIAGGGFEDMYPYELFLEEGFSRVYKARLTLLSDTLHTYDDLAEIVDTNISLTISQVLRDAVTMRTRYLHGIITAAATDGVFSGGEQNCYRYTLTIESELARLRYNARNGAYYKQSPVDAVEAVLANNHITARFSDSFIRRNEYSTRLMFNQNGVSDIEFIGNILFTYGISFASVHPAVSVDAMGASDLVFSDGNSFPAPVLEYSDNRETPETAQFDFVRADEAQDTWKMDAFRMENAIGVDGIEVSATYPEFNYGNKEWKAGDPGADKRSLTYNRLFTGYER
ncbi:MAG: phage late control D family protein, partial [Treponema sp.]|nr:phage late control D family protein [Treponema sp.]